MAITSAVSDQLLVKERAIVDLLIATTKLN